MLRCPKCDNDMRTSKLVTAMGDIMVAGTIGSDPQPISAEVCSACGYIELYAPQPFEQPEKAEVIEMADPLLVPSGGTLVA